MIQITEKEVLSTENKYVHRIGTDSYFKKATKLPNDTAEMFEEVDAIPAPPTEEEIAFKAETESKVKEMFFSKSIPTAINTYGLTAKEALSVKEMFPNWEEGIDVKVGERYQHKGKLYEVVQEHKTQADWVPTKQSSLWTEVSYHEGTLSDPIPFNEELDPFWQGMVLIKDKYYTQNGVVYLCIRNSGNKIVQELKYLVGNYVSIV